MLVQSRINFDLVEIWIANSLSNPNAKLCISRGIVAAG